MDTTATLADPVPGMDESPDIGPVPEHGDGLGGGAPFFGFFSPGRAKKHSDGKPRMDLLSPRAQLATAAALTHGAAKYGDRNWEQGAPFSEYYAALQRHLAAWFAGEDADPESGLSHLDHAACCLMFLQDFVRGGYRAFDDRPGRREPGPGHVYVTICWDKDNVQRGLDLATESAAALNEQGEPEARSAVCYPFEPRDRHAWDTVVANARAWRDETGADGPLRLVEVTEVLGRRLTEASPLSMPGALALACEGSRCEINPGISDGEMEAALSLLEAHWIAGDLLAATRGRATPQITQAVAG